MAPTSQAQESIRDYEHLPERCAPTSWTTAEPAQPPAVDPFTFDQEYVVVARFPYS